MSSTLSPPRSALLRGSQRPRLESIPASVLSEGARVAKLAARAGLVLDPWQEYVLDVGLGRRDDRMWAAFEVALIVSRQNGKGSILEALELAALFLDKSLPPNALRLAGLRALGMPEAQIRAKLAMPKRTYYDAVEILRRPRR